MRRVDPVEVGYHDMMGLDVPVGMAFFAGVLSSMVGQAAMARWRDSHPNHTPQAAWKFPVANGLLGIDVSA